MKSKTIGGELLHLFDFGQRMPVGETLTESGITVETMYGEEAVPALTFALRAFDRQGVTYGLIGGTSGVIYRVFCSVKTTAGNIYYSMVPVAVIGD